MDNCEIGFNKNEIIVWDGNWLIKNVYLKILNENCFFVYLYIIWKKGKIL